MQWRSAFDAILRANVDLYKARLRLGSVNRRNVNGKDESEVETDSLRPSDTFATTNLTGVV